MLAMVAVTSAVLLIIMSGRFVRYLGDAASGKIAGDVLFWIMFYRLPNFFELILPLGFFIGILLAYGRFYVESEMVVLNACGFSTNKLLVYTLIPAIFIALIMSSISLYLSPEGVNRAQKILNDPNATTGFSTLVPGRFQKMDNGRVSYVENLNNDKTQLGNVFFADVVPATRTTDGQVTLLFADSGKVVKHDGSEYLELADGHRYQMKNKTIDVKSTAFTTYGARMDKDESEVADSDKFDALPTSVLLSSDSLEHQATLQWRVSLSLIIPIVAIIALSLSKTDHRRGRYVKMLPAIMIYLIYLVLLSTGRSAIAKGSLPPEYGLWVIHLAFLTLGLGMLYLPGVWQRFNYRRNLQAGES